MTARQDMQRLHGLAQLIRDARLDGLRRAAQLRDQTLSRLEGLNATAAGDDLHPVAAGMAQVAFEGWADARRRELTRLLARQTADLAEAEAAARDAFGRADVLGKLESRLDRRR